MGRWQPDAKGRLAAAAYELYARKGYEAATGAEIAARAGMHERSVFRLFGDKKEIPFHGMEDVAAGFAETIRSAPEGLSAFELAQRAVEGQCALININPAHAKLRHDVIMASPDLRERDLAKHAELAEAIADALLIRRIDGIVARLAAESCVLALRIAVEEWLRDSTVSDLNRVFNGVVDRLRATVSSVGDSTP
ncbi:MAG: TetR/AcrR family transcriptional regulator [Bifidobacteriaceae bacterium]|jgi:AcrR family transcriptional regulator|nr:TetR/AcrR family transcriptional regulator [Bifidobacteriaceae bacterium]